MSENEPLLNKIWKVLSLMKRKGKQKLIKMNEDRISKLPDSILCKILSLLDLKLSIQTSLISKRWKPLWTFLPNLNFDFHKFRLQFSSLEWLSSYQAKQILLAYTHFVNQVLSHRDNSSSICKFRLAFDDFVDPIFVKNCVDYAINHHVQELDIAAYYRPKPFQFPEAFFDCQSLQKLRLKHGYSKNMLIPKNFCLPGLKSLYLECFEFKDDDHFCIPKDPFSGFRNLEELTLNCCMLHGLTISASKLRMLELLFRGSHPQFSSELKMETVSTPNLTSFKFEGQVSLICPMDNFPCLEKIYVDLYPILEDPYTNEVERRMPMNLINLLVQLKNAKSVTLSLDTIQVLAMDLKAVKHNPSPFHEMKHLKLITEPAWRFSNTIPPQNVITYLTEASCYRDKIVVELAKS